MFGSLLNLDFCMHLNANYLFKQFTPLELQTMSKIFAFVATNQIIYFFYGNTQTMF